MPCVSAINNSQNCNYILVKIGLVELYFSLQIKEERSNGAMSREVEMEGDISFEDIDKRRSVLENLVNYLQNKLRNESTNYQTNKNDGKSRID